MKTLLFYFVFILPLISSAQTQESTTQVDQSDLTESYSKQHFNFGIENSFVNSDYKANIGLYLGEHFLLSLNYGNMSNSKTSSGGDLQAWQYVENKTKISGNYVSMDLTYYFTSTSLRTHSIYLKAGVGRYFSQLNYNYDRYKPYNGAFCLFSCPTKAVEESDSGTQSVSTDFGKIGIGYTWAFRMKKSALNIYTGIEYFGVLNPYSTVLGNTHKHSVSTDLIEPLMASGGLSFSFN